MFKDINLNIQLASILVQANIEVREDKIKKKYFEQYENTFGSLEVNYKKAYEQLKTFSSKEKQVVKSFVKFILLQERLKYFKVKEINDSLVNQNEQLICLYKDKVTEVDNLKEQLKLAKRKF